MRNKYKYDLKRIKVTKSLAWELSDALVELQGELYESSKACWSDDSYSLQKRITELRNLDKRLCRAIFHKTQPSVIKNAFAIHFDGDTTN